MPQDAFTLEYLAQELDKLLAGGKVNKITQPDADEFYLGVYSARSNYRVVVSTNVSSARVCTSAEERPNPAVAYNFCMLLRKHLGGATIKKIELDGFDRVIKMTFTALGEFLEPEEKILYAELMGKYSNAILVAKGRILGALKTAAVDEAARRPLLAGMAYTPPPAQDKLPPDDPALEEVLACADENKIFASVGGLSRVTAAEIAFGVRASHANAYAALKEFFADRTIAPCVGFCDGKPVDFFVRPYKSQELEYKMFPTLIAAEEYFFGERERAARFAQLKNRLTERVNKEIKKYERRLQMIGDKRLDCRDLERYRINGEILLANIYRVKKGDASLTAENYYDGGSITIKLDPTLSPQKNAERFFAKYNKQKRTLKALEPQEEETNGELDYLKGLRSALAVAADVGELVAVEEEMKAEGLIRSAAGQTKKQPAPKFIVYEIEGYTVRAGRNNVENDLLTSSARGKDLWLHAKGYHSAHVIIEGRPPENVILEAAEICAYYSSARGGTKIDVDYTEKRNVHKPRGGKSGAAIYTDFSTLTVDPDKHEEHRRK